MILKLKTFLRLHPGTQLGRGEVGGGGTMGEMGGAAYRVNSPRFFAGSNNLTFQYPRKKNIKSQPVCGYLRISTKPNFFIFQYLQISVNISEVLKC